MLNYYFQDTIESFLLKSTAEIIGLITMSNQFDSTNTQNKSWEQQIPILKKALKGYKGTVFFEFSIPRMGKRIDSLVIVDNIVFVIEFKVGESQFLLHHIDQVWDYALDLKNFHKPSHDVVLVPILVATLAKKSFVEIITTSHHDNLILPIKTNQENLSEAIIKTLGFFSNDNKINL